MALSVAVSAAVPTVTVRRHWCTFRTPWMVRKSRDTRARLPEAYAYDGPSTEVDSWVRALVVRTGSFEHPAIGLEAASPAPRRTRRHRPDPLDVADAAVEIGTSGGGDFGSSLDGSEFGLVILAILALVVLAAIAVPLGLIAIELALTIGLAAAGVVLRLARIKPWTVLVLRNGIVVAAVSVKGWRPSRAVIAALRQQLVAAQH